MWLVHFGHFVGTVIGIFFGAIGSTILGLFIDGAFAVSITAVALYRKNRVEGWGAMLRHWRQEYKAALRVAIWSALIIYGPVVGWSIGKAAYADHEGLVSRSQEQRKQIRMDQGNILQQSTADSAKLVGCENDTARLGGQNETLNAQNRDQQDTISNCQTQALKLLTPEPLKFTPVVLDPVNSGIGEQHVKWLLLTNKTVTPVILRVSCNKRPTSVSGAVIGSGANIGGLGRKITASEYEIDISSPAWSPVSPMTVDLSYIGSEDVSCNFQEM